MTPPPSQTEGGSPPAVVIGAMLVDGVDRAVMEWIVQREKSGVGENMYWSEWSFFGMHYFWWTYPKLRPLSRTRFGQNAPA